jgi:hypothetical protein
VPRDGATGSDDVAVSQLQVLAEQLRREVAEPGHCPVLSVPAYDLEAAFTELQAGIDAMR